MHPMLRMYVEFIEDCAAQTRELERACRIPEGALRPLNPDLRKRCVNRIKAAHHTLDRLQALTT